MDFLFAVISWQISLDSHLPSRRPTSMESQWHGLVLFSVNGAHSVLDLHGCSQSNHEEQIALL